ncbi:MAG: nucleotidyltransferase domain-containing protein [Chloroflexi bacterium]|nr:nucleotidyltransferase domain-containing protein [Chloroflexota bacterium]
MTKHLNEASQWRIEFAEALAPHYQHHKQVKMIVLGGSPARGLSDRYSDLDVIVYWDTIDFDWLQEDPPLAKVGGQRKLLNTHKTTTAIEHYYFDTIKVDFAHITLNLWETWANDLQKRYETTGHKQKSIAGFLDAKLLYGEALYDQWHNRLTHYPEQLAQNVVKEQMRFFVEGCLLHQGLGRGEILFFYDGVSLMLKRVLAILGGLNKVYFSTDEPRWIPYELEKMNIRPPHVWQRIQEILEGDKRNGLMRLYDLIYEVLALVETHMPDIDVATTRQRMSALSVHGCDSKPKLKEITDGY